MGAIVHSAHKGLSILVSEGGQFFVDGREDLGRHETLGKVRDAIDKELKRSFTRFEAVIFSGRGYSDDREKIQYVTVTSITKERWGTQAWIKEKAGGRSKHSVKDVYKNTPENIAAMKQVLVHDLEARKQRDAAQKLIAQLERIDGKGEEDDDADA